MAFAPSPTATTAWVKGLLFSIVGVVLVVAAGLSAYATAGFIRRSQVMPGVVVDTRYGQSHPDIRFTTRNGQTLTYSQGGAVFGMSQGKAVRVRYDPADPGRAASLDTPVAIWSVAGMLAVLGLGLTALGASALVRARSHNTVQR